MYRLSATDTKGQCFRKCIASTKISNEHSSSCLVQTNNKCLYTAIAQMILELYLHQVLEFHLYRQVLEAPGHQLSIINV